MAYSTGMMRQKVTIAKRDNATQNRYGLDAAGIRWIKVGTFWAAVDWKRGMKEMREGALDAYDFIMVRMRWRDDIDRDCLLKHDDRWYQIESFHRDYEANTIQITARERANSDTDLYELRSLCTTDDEPITDVNDLGLTVKVKI